MIIENYESETIEDKCCRADCGNCAQWKVGSFDATTTRKINGSIHTEEVTHKKTFRYCMGGCGTVTTHYKSGSRTRQINKKKKQQVEVVDGELMVIA